MSSPGDHPSQLFLAKSPAADNVGRRQAGGCDDERRDELRAHQALFLMTVRHRIFVEAVRWEGLGPEIPTALTPRSRRTAAGWGRAVTRR